VKPVQPTPKKPPPYFRCDWEIADASALQALAAGTADPTQQKRAIDFIIRRTSGYYDLSFQPGMPDAMSFMEGRRFVGAKIVELLSISVRDLLQKEQRNKGT
jgi:hypothetical protein